jgi:hypothetical protein
MTQDLETQLAEQKTALAELHAAFSSKLDAGAAAHRQQCAEQSAELRIREMAVADKLKLAIALDVALKERAIALDRKERALLEEHSSVRSALAGIADAIDKEAAARASAVS